MLQVGIVGLPNVGKSTVFNALARGGAKVSNYPFCTVEPNRATVAVPDPRLETLGRIFQQQQTYPAALQFVDIAGLVRGASKGEGLGNQFLAHIREVDALLHVVRCFQDENIIHVEGQVDPVRDAEVVDLELALADLATLAKRVDKMSSAAKAHDRQAIHDLPILERLRDALNEGRWARTTGLTAEQAASIADLHLLTLKPVIYLGNADEQASEQADAWVTSLEAYASAHGAASLVLTARLEAELGELSEEERGEYAKEMGLSATGLERVIQTCYRLLDLVTFFTGVGKELRAWAVPTGTPAPVAAGKVHTDMEKGFIRAEVIGYDKLVAAGSWEDAHKHGLIRIEGKDYPIVEGDVVHFRFHV